MNNNRQKRYFRHFKGGLYKLLYEARDSETREEEVVYQALYGERGIWVRPKKMFFEEVERDGYRGPRFKEISRVEASPYSELPICSHLKKKLVGEYTHLMEVVEGDEELSYKPVGRALGIYYGRKRVLTLYGKKGAVVMDGVEEIDPVVCAEEYFEEVKNLVKE